jgi:hypothetical protein
MDSRSQSTIWTVADSVVLYEQSQTDYYMGSRSQSTLWRVAVRVLYGKVDEDAGFEFQ